MQTSAGSSARFRFYFHAYKAHVVAKLFIAGKGSQFEEEIVEKVGQGHRPAALKCRSKPLDAQQFALAFQIALLFGQAGDSARVRAADELRWRMGGATRFLILAVLTYWGYLELTVAYLLGPTTIVSVPVLLYNQMHFGKNAVLSAMTFLAVVVPVAFFIATAALRPVIRRFFWR